MPGHGQQPCQEHRWIYDHHADPHGHVLSYTKFLDDEPANHINIKIYRPEKAGGRPPACPSRAPPSTGSNKCPRGYLSQVMGPAGHTKDLDCLRGHLASCEGWGLYTCLEARPTFTTCQLCDVGKALCLSVSSSVT